MGRVDSTFTRLPLKPYGSDKHSEMLRIYYGLAIVITWSGPFRILNTTINLIYRVEEEKGLLKGSSKILFKPQSQKRKNIIVVVSTLHFITSLSNHMKSAFPSPFHPLKGNADYFKAYAPKLYCYYMNTIDKLISWSPLIKRIFKGTTFAALTFNLGPRTVMYAHRDFSNLSWGLVCNVCSK